MKTITSFLRCSALAAAITLAPAASYAQLAAGDVIFTGYDQRGATNGSSGYDWFSFVLTKKLTVGSTINFTDIGYIGSGAANNSNTFTNASVNLEGTLSWLSGAELPTGTEVTIVNSSSGWIAYLNGTGTTTNGSVSVTSNIFNLQGNDQVIAYTGTLSPSATFLAGIHWNPCSGNAAQSTWDPVTNCTGTSSSSQIPPGLTGGTNAIYVGAPTVGGSYDYCKFRCTTPVSPHSPANFRTAASNPSNWDLNDVTGSASSPVGAACGRTGATGFATLLPVTWLSFNAAYKEGNVIVEWTVGQESDVTGYQVERSENGQDFQSAGVVIAQGSKFYRFTDWNAGIAPNYFYRLKTQTTDGNTQYSSTVRVMNLSVPVADMRLLHNPAGASLDFEIAAAADGLASIIVTDVTGRLVLQQQWPVHAGRQTVSCPTTCLQPDQVYLLTGAADGKVWHTRVVR